MPASPLSPPDSRPPSRRHRAPRFSNDAAIAFARKVTAAGGAITWDTPIQKGGTFAPEFVAQLQAIGATQIDFPT